LRQNEAGIDQHGAEGPDALQGSIRTSISVLDFGKKWDGTDVSAEALAKAEAIPP